MTQEPFNSTFYVYGFLGRSLQQLNYSSITKLYFFQQLNYTGTLADTEQKIREDYRRYESYKEKVKDKSEETQLTEAQIEDYKNLKDYFGDSSLEKVIEDERVRINERKSKYGWTQEELVFAISDAILNSDPSYTPEPGLPNVKAKNVTLEANGGSIGKNLETQTGNLVDLGNGSQEGLNLYKALARAEAGDVEWDWEKKTVTINPKRSLEFEQVPGGESSFEAHAKGNIYLQSVGQSEIVVGNITSDSGDLRLTANNGIQQAEDSRFKAKDLILRGGKGALGNSDQHIKAQLSGNVTLSSEKGIFFDQYGDLNIKSVSGGSDVYLAGKNIYSVKEDGVITGTSFTFETKGDIGNSDRSLKLQSDEDFDLKVVEGDVTGLYVESVGKGNVELKAEKADGSESSLAVAGGAKLQAQGSIDVKSNMSVESGLFYAESQNGGLNFKDLDIKDAPSLTLKAKDDIVSEGGSWIVSETSDVYVESTEGSILLKSDAVGDGLVAHDITFKAAKGGLGMQGKSLEASGSITLEAGSIDLTSSSLTAQGTEEDDGITLRSKEGDILTNGETKLHSSKSLEADSAGKLDLSEADVEFSDRLKLKAGSTEDDALKMFSSSNASSGSVYKGTDIEIESAGGVLFKDGPIEMEATDGSVKVSAGILDFDQDVSLKAKDAVEVGGSRKLNVSGDFNAEGDSVLVSGGIESFVFGGQATVEAKNGNAEVMSDGDATFAGKLEINSENGDISVGAKGVLSVQENDFTITSDKDITLYGGNGLNIKDDLTIVTPGNAKLKSDGGSIDIGNGATVLTGSVINPDNHDLDQKGNLDIEAGGSLNIGEDATLLSDQLQVQAKGDITFGKNATLEGKNGVDIESSGGSIHMGEDLTVLSDSNETKFKAAEDIVIDRDARLFTEDDSVVFEAGRNIEFKDDFNLYADQFTLKAKGNLTVGDDATVTTWEDSNENSAKKDASFDVGGDVTFGKRAGFAADDVVIEAGGSITLDSEATLVGESVKLRSGNENLSSGGNVHLGDGSTIVSTDDIDIEAAGDIVIDGEFASVSEGTTNFKTGKGDIRISDDSVLLSEGDIVFDAGRNFEIGDRSAILTSKLDSDEDPHLSHDDIDIKAGGNVTLGSDSFVFTDATLDVEAGGSVDVGSRSLLGAVTREQSDGEIVDESGRFELKAGGDLNIGSDSLLYGEEHFDMDVGGSANIGEGSSLVADNSLDLYAGGDIEFKAGSSVQSLNDSGYVPDVNLEAKGRLWQDSASDGIYAENLNAKSGSDMYLGSRSGNRMKNAQLQSGGSIGAHFNSDDVSVGVNQETGGNLNGSLELSNESGNLEMNGSVNAKGSVDLSADSLKTGDVAASGSMVFGVNKGEIRSGNLTSGSDMTLFRSSQDQSGGIHTGQLESGGNTTLLNGNGEIDVQGSHSVGPTMVFTSPDAPQPDPSLFSSDSGKVFISPTAGAILGVWDKLDPHNMPFGIDDLFRYGSIHHSLLYKWGYDTNDPNGRLFWLGLRNEKDDDYTHLPIEGLVNINNHWKEGLANVVLSEASEEEESTETD